MSNHFTILRNKGLKYSHGEKSSKGPFTIYIDTECLLQKMYSCQNNPDTQREKLNTSLQAGQWL